MEATLARTGYLCVIWQITEQITAICGVIEFSGWHGVLDRGTTLDGVFLATKPPRFVGRRHFTFRDVPTP